MHGELRDLDAIRRVVVTRLRWLGDVVMSTPMLEALREALPQARIEYLTNIAFAPVLERHPACDRVLTVERKGGWRRLRRTLGDLRGPRVDWCFDTFGNPRSAILVALASPRSSVGPRRGIRSRLYTHSVRNHPDVRSAVRRQLDLLTPLLGRVETRHTTLYVSPDEQVGAARRFGLDPGANVAILHPGATRAERAWPGDRWPDLIEELQERIPDLKARFVTQPGWENTVRQIVARCTGDVARLPVLPLREFMGLLANASLYIGNDGGTLHTAVAMRVPTVGLLGRSEKAVWFPYESWGPYLAVGGHDQPVDDSKGKSPEIRHASVREVADAAGRVTQGQPVRAERRPG